MDSQSHVFEFCTQKSKRVRCSILLTVQTNPLRSLAYERAREGESGDLPNSPPTTVETVSVICRG